MECFLLSIFLKGVFLSERLSNLKRQVNIAFFLLILINAMVYFTYFILIVSCIYIISFIISLVTLSVGI